jgi:hypothetical protein
MITELEIHTLRQDLFHLERSYEDFFCGKAIQIPEKEALEFDIKVKQFLGNQIDSTAIRFQVNALANRFRTMQRLWKRRLEYKISSTDTLEAPSLNPAILDSLYNDLRVAYIKCEKPFNVSFNTLEDYIKTNYEHLKQKYGDSQINFRVVIENNNPKIKAVVQQ